jgi:putative membrane protein
MARASTFLSAAERFSVEEALASAELQTSGEIITAVATSSGRYDRAEDLIGVVTAVLLLVAGWLSYQAFGMTVQPSVGDWSTGVGTGGFLLLQVALVLIGFMLGTLTASRLPVIAALFISKKEMAEEVGRRAQEIFYRERVRSTKEGAGVLIYISLFERMVRILPDDAISKEVTAGQWEEICRALLDAIKQKRAGEGLREAVFKSGQLLNRYFPHQAGRDINELSNTVRIYD